MRTEVEPTRGRKGDGRNVRGGRNARKDGAWPGATQAAWGRGCGVRRPLGRSGSGLRGWDRAGAAPTCAGRPQAQVAEVAQAAGLRLRGGFSITTSPALERAGRGAAPRAAEARAGRGGRGVGRRGAILGRARERAREPVAGDTCRSLAEGRTLRDARISGRPAAQPPWSAASPAPGSPGPRALPLPPETPVQPGTALCGEAPDSPSAPRRAQGPHSRARRTDEAGAGAAVAVAWPRRRGEGPRGDSLLHSCGNSP